MTVASAPESRFGRLIGRVRGWMPRGGSRRRDGDGSFALKPARLPVARVKADPAQQALSMALALLSGVLIALVVNMVGISQLQHLTSQARLYHELRLTLAEGATPTGPLDSSGQVVPLGTPVAVMSAPEIGIQHEVIVNGTSSAQTMQGIGYRRDTTLPCQAGSSVLMARSGGYGAIGQDWAHLQNGDRFSITMGQGSCTYQVIGQRLAGAAAPPAPIGDAGALTLVTATGYPFVPTGVLRIDATLVSNSFPRPAVAFPTGALPASELDLGSDSSQLFPLTMLLEALVALAIGATFLWRRWNPLKTFVVVTPVALALIFLTAQSLNLLLPNLL